MIFHVSPLREGGVAFFTTSLGLRNGASLDYSAALLSVRRMETLSVIFNDQADRPAGSSRIVVWLKAWIPVHAFFFECTNTGSVHRATRSNTDVRGLFACETSPGSALP